MERKKTEMMNWIDSHAHIYLDAFDSDRQAVLARAVDCGVNKVLMPNIDRSSIAGMLAIEEDLPCFCYAMMGLHPCSVKDDFKEELEEMRRWIDERNFVAIGEIGIDLYWDQTFVEQQIEAFETQIAWAKNKEWPIVIHSRESLDLCIEVVERNHSERLTGVFHCFNGTIEQARRIEKLGFYYGLGGVSTFKNGGMDKVIPHLDKNHILLETDSPYLTPAPYRGKRNEPSYIPIIGEVVSRLLEISPENLSEITSANCQQLFEL